MKKETFATNYPDLAPDSEGAAQVFSMLEKEYRAGRVAHWMEKQMPISGVMYDLDCFQRDEVPQITPNHIEEFVRGIADVYASSLDFGEAAKFGQSIFRETSFHLAVIKRELKQNDEGELVLPMSVKHGAYKHGFHILIPDVLMSKPQKYWMYEKVKKVFDRVFAKLSFCNAADDHPLDYAANHGPVCFLGSAKPERKDFYPLGRVWVTEFDDDMTHDIRQLGIRECRALTPVELAINRWGPEKVMDKVERLPRIRGNVDEFGAWLVERKAKKEAALAEFAPTADEIAHVLRKPAEALSIISRAVMALDSTRAHESPKWRAVLGVLANLARVYRFDTLPLAVEFSAQSDKFKGPEDVEGASRPFGYMSLLWKWLKEDNPREFNPLYRKFAEICPPRETIQSVLLKGVISRNDSDSLFSKALLMLVRNDIKVDDDGNGYVWDERERVWQFTPERMLFNQVKRLAPYMISVEKKCHSRVLGVVHEQELAAAARVEAKESMTPAIKKQEKAALKGAEATHAFAGLMTVKSGNVTKMKTIWAYGAAELVDMEFIEGLDTEENYVATNDGNVVDLTTGKAEERTRDHMCSFAIPCHLVESTGIGDKFFASLFLDAEVCQYMKDRIGAFLHGKSLREIDCWYGEGRNGKSVLLRVLGKMMGKHAVLANRGIFIDQDKNTSSSGHTSHLIPIIGRRLVMCSEIKKNDALNPVMLKSLSGSDAIPYRGAYQREEKTFTSKAAYVLVVNARPRFDADDQAMLDRLRFIEFASRFTDKPKGNEQLADDKFIKLVESPQGLNEIFTMAVRGAMRYCANGLEAPAAVLEATKRSVGQEDFLAGFLEQYETFGDCSEMKLEGRKDKASTQFCREWGVNAKHFLSRYNDYRRENNAEQVYKRELHPLMLKRGFRAAKHKRAAYFFGLKRAECETDSDDE